MTLLEKKKDQPPFKALNIFFHSIWFFPALLTVLLIVLSILQLSGSSIGIYNKVFYGNEPDKNLIANQPESIRSDEWIVNTQKIIAQKNNNYSMIDQNMGQGEDVSILYDIPYKDWSIIFKPQNIGYLVLPFDIAFALHWWIMAYFLVLAVYFFAILLLPKKRVLATILSLAFLFSPFVQWWYQYGTLGPIYYCLFGLIIFMKLIHSKKHWHSILWGLLLSYIAVCFALVIYPPFQIPCAIVALAFALGYLLDTRKLISVNLLKRNLLFLLAGLVIAGSVVGLFLYQRKDTIATINDTVYPGQRLVQSGGYSVEHLLSSQLSTIFQNPTRAAAYSRPSISATNQSESSNFMLLFTFLIVPTIYLSYLHYKRKRQSNYSILIPLLVGGLFTAWMFIPGLNIIGSFTLLNKVPLPRLLIGFGILNLVLLVSFIRFYLKSGIKFSSRSIIIYSVLILLAELLLNIRVAHQFPQFIGLKSAILLALPFPVITFLLLKKRIILASLLLLLFSFFSVWQVNPLYKGTSTLTQTPISVAIQQITKSNPTKRWISEDIYLENFATMNGAPSLDGTYLYPQLNLWNELNQPNSQNIYDRYAHVNFTFDRDVAQNLPPVLSNPGPDQMNIKIEPCDSFFKQNNVGFLITSAKFASNTATCTSLMRVVSYPTTNYYIYRLNF